MLECSKCYVATERAQQAFVDGGWQAARASHNRRGTPEKSRPCLAIRLLLYSAE